MRMKHTTMTEGRIAPLLLRFALPLFLGNLLQQLYNAFDAIVVGNYVSSEALAAVGASGPIINMIISFFMGMSQGASVLISQAYGARDNWDMRGVVHTAVSLAVLLGAVLSVVGVIITPSLLRAMLTPEEIFADAVTYLRIYFAGMIGLTVYNIGAAILTAIGDTRRPLYYLIITSVLNISLNLLFVVGFGMGIDGVAIATVIAQMATAVLVVVTLCKADGPHRLSLRDLRIELAYVKRIVNVGLPGAIEQSIISASNIFVQSYFNRLGAQAVAGYAATAKLDAFLMLPVQTMAMTCATFVGQNLGAKNVKRARRGVKTAMITAFVMTLAMSAVALVFGSSLLRLFTPEPAVIEYGMRFLRTFAPLYFVLCFSHVIPGALRGAGDVRVSMFTYVGSFVVLRQIYLLFITKIQFTPETVAFGYPLTWAIAGVVLTVYYLRRNWDAFERA